MAWLEQILRFAHDDNKFFEPDSFWRIVVSIHHDLDSLSSASLGFILCQLVACS
jgi:hypothetical protein